MKWQDFHAELEAVIKGDVDLPNYEPLDLKEGVANIACMAGLKTIDGVRYARVPGETHPRWARFFLTSGQGGGFDGGGYVMLYGGYGDGGKIGRFALCKHEKKEGAGANHQRGWHPGHCTKCGLDMSVDSGD